VPRHTRAALVSTLGHACSRTRGYVSREHLLTVLASVLHRGQGPRPARVVLYQHGATTADVQQEIARRAGPGAVLFGGLDPDAMAAIGIDLDAVRARVESSFTPEALAQAMRRQPRRSWRKRGPSALVLLRRAHPDVFEDALAAVINKSTERTS
jgi:hypothetical protein